MDNRLLIIAGPSGVGKTVVAKKIAEIDSRFTFLRSATTRKRRGDSHDDEYVYYTEEEFIKAIESGEIVESMTYLSNLYGTTTKEIDRAYREGRIPLLVLDLKGVESLSLDKRFSASVIYIYAERDVIEKRLYGRIGDNPTPEEIDSVLSRIARNEADFAVLDDYSRYFYSAIENISTVESAANEAIACFDGFSVGELPRKEKIEIALKKLKA